MPLFEIKNRWTGSVIFSLECESIKLCVEAAVKASVSLSDSDLRGSNLSYSNLRGSDLRGSNLSDSNLRGSDLSYSNLRGSNLRGSDLRGSNLSDSNLRGSDLSYSNLRGSNLRGSDLRGSNLSDSNLRGSDLSYSNLRGSDLRGSNLSDSNLRGSDLRKDQLAWFRDDIWAVLSSSPVEVPALREALASGQVDGSTYSGECCCLVGTLAKNRHCGYDAIPGLTPDSSRPAEQWFLGIKKGDTPETSRSSKFALEWVDQWMTNMRAAFGAEIFGGTE